MSDERIAEFGLAIKGTFTEGLSYWRTVLAIYVAGLITAHASLGSLSVFLSTFIGALIFHKFDRKLPKALDFIFRVCIASVWTWILVNTDFGILVVESTRKLFI